MHTVSVQWPRLFIVCGVLSAPALSANATAANLDTADAGNPPREDASVLSEIIVSAQRREEALDKVPISVAAFSQKTMDDLHIENFSDLATIVPGLVVSTPIAGQQDNSDVAIRGIFSGGNAPTTQFYIDETPVAIRTLPAAGPSGSPRPLIFDLDRVEVLRGPQGTLFGSSAMGGAIRYITPQPSLTDISTYAKADLSYTDRGGTNYEAGLAFGAPVVTGTAGFRVSGWFQSNSGFIDKEDPFSGDITSRNANTSQSYVIRPAFTWAPTDNLTITPALFMQEFSQRNPNTYWLDFLPYQEAGAHVSGAIGEPVVDRLNVSSLAIKYTFLGMALQSDTSYLDRKEHAVDDFTHGTEDIFGGTPFVPGLAQNYINYFDDQTYTHAWQQEIRLSSQNPDARISWVGGLYYRHAVQGLQQSLPGSLDPLTEAIAGENTLQFTGNQDYLQANGQIDNAFTQFETTDISEAVFGQVTVNIIGGLKANLGARYEHSVVEHQHQISAGPTNGLTYANQVLADEVGNPVTPKVGLTYQYTQNDMVYVSAAKGYRAGGGNGATAIGNPLCAPSLSALGLTTVPSTFSSDSLWSYEIGAKDSLFEHRLAIEASAFYIDWTNIQTQVQLPSCAEVFTANRGKAVSRGFDLQIAAIPVEGLKLGANVGYTDAYYPNAAYGAASNGVVPLLNAAGDKLANVLPWTASANAEYSHDISGIWSDARAYLRVDYRWLSGANSLNPNAADYDPMTGPYQNPAYSILNLRLGVLHQGLDVSLYVDNATRSDPTLAYAHDLIGDPQLYASAIRPLTFGITAYYRH